MFRLFNFLLLIPLISTYIQLEQPEHPRLKLTWDFFRNDKPAGEYYSACTYANFDYTYQTKSFTKNEIKVKFIVNYKLDTAKSYFEAKYVMKDYNLLAHEQGHADLGVIHARKMYKELTAAIYNKENYKKKIESIFNKVLAEWKIENQRYDEETAFSKNHLAQNEWNVFFDANFYK